MDDHAGYMKDHIEQIKNTEKRLDEALEILENKKVEPTEPQAIGVGD